MSSVTHWAFCAKRGCPWTKISSSNHEEDAKEDASLFRSTLSALALKERHEMLMLLGFVKVFDVPPRRIATARTEIGTLQQLLLVVALRRVAVLVDGANIIIIVPLWGLPSSAR
eukprot:scaffold7176_cov145-Amphora_coffeaeformis.AAC.7